MPEVLVRDGEPDRSGIVFLNKGEGGSDIDNLVVLILHLMAQTALNETLENPLTGGEKGVLFKVIPDRSVGPVDSSVAVPEIIYTWLF